MNSSPATKKALLAVSMVVLNVAVATAVHFAWTAASPPAQASVKRVVPAAPTDEDRVVNAISKSSPAVVSVLIQKEQDGQLQEVGRGTGFLVTADGMIVTNRHVAGDRTATYTVFLADDSQYDAKVLDIDPVNDLALLKIDGKGLPTAALETNDSLRIGQTVVAIGNALGKYADTVTRGILSGVNRSIDADDPLTGGTEHLEDVLQTDAAINEGNSGGPLVDLDGRVIGVDTAIESDGAGLGFAIPVSEVRKVLASYARYGAIARPRLGVRYVSITPDIAVQDKLAYKDGALIQSSDAKLPSVLPDGPAAKAGLHDGDIILEINGVAIQGKRTLTKIIRDYSVGDQVTLKIARGGDILSFTLTLDAYPRVP